MNIKLIKFNEAWAELFLREKKNIKKALGNLHVDSIEHIGATSAVVCSTAGTIDVLVGMNLYSEIESAVKKLENSGYIYKPELSNEKMSFMIHKDTDGNVVATVRIVVNASLTYQRYLGFKYYLTECAENAVKYNKFRETLLDACKGDAKTYNRIKSNYIQNILDDLCVFNG